MVMCGQYACMQAGTLLYRRTKKRVRPHYPLGHRPKDAPLGPGGEAACFLVHYFSNSMLRKVSSTRLRRRLEQPQLPAWCPLHATVRRRVHAPHGQHTRVYRPHTQLRPCPFALPVVGATQQYCTALARRTTRIRARAGSVERIVLRRIRAALLEGVAVPRLKRLEPILLGVLLDLVVAGDAHQRHLRTMSI